MTLPPSPHLSNWTFRQVMVATLVLASVAIGFWLIYRFYQVIFILFVSIILGTVIRPVVNRLNHYGVPRAAGIILFYVIIFIFVIGFLLMLFPLVFDQGVTIIKAIPDYFELLRTWLSSSSNEFVLSLSQYLPATVPGFEIIQRSGAEELASAETAIGYIATASKIVFFVIVILVLAFYWALNGTKNMQALILLLPKTQREKFDELIVAMESKIGYFIAGQGALCLVVGILALIGYLLIGLPNALVLALIAGVLEAVPIIGPTIGAIPAGVIALSVSPVKLVWVVVVTVIIQILENNLLVPRIMSKAVGVNPFVSLLAIFAFSSLFGIAGALMAVPIAAIIQIVLDRFVFHPDVNESKDSSGRDITSRLRYETQELVQDLRKQARLKKGGSALKESQIDKAMDEVESLANDLDTLLSRVPQAGSHD